MELKEMQEKLQQTCEREHQEANESNLEQEHETKGFSENHLQCYQSDYVVKRNQCAPKFKENLVRKGHSKEYVWSHQTILGHL